MDFSRGLAIHRLYGHSVFVVEAGKRGKDQRFVTHICQSISCTGQAVSWRNNLPTHIASRRS